MVIVANCMLWNNYKQCMNEDYIYGGIRLIYNRALFNFAGYVYFYQLEFCKIGCLVVFNKNKSLDLYTEYYISTCTV